MHPETSANHSFESRHEHSLGPTFDDSATPPQIGGESGADTLPFSSMARAMGSFLLNLIAHIELELLGGEFGSATCHDVLTHKQVMALGEAIAAGAAVASDLSLRNPGNADLPELLKAQAQSVRTAGNMSRASRTAVALALEDAAGQCSRPRRRRGDADQPGEEVVPQRVAAVAALSKLAEHYLGGFGDLVLLYTQRRCGMTRQDVVDCFAWTDTGMGLITAWISHCVDRETTWTELLAEVQDQLNRSTWEQASHQAQDRFCSMVAGLLSELT